METPSSSGGRDVVGELMGEGAPAGMRCGTPPCRFGECCRRCRRALPDITIPPARAGLPNGVEGILMSDTCRRALPAAHGREAGAADGLAALSATLHLDADRLPLGPRDSDRAFFVETGRTLNRFLHDWNRALHEAPPEYQGNVRVANEPAAPAAAPTATTPVPRLHVQATKGTRPPRLPSPPAGGSRQLRALRRGGRRGVLR